MFNQTTGYIGGANQAAGTLSNATTEVPVMQEIQNLTVQVSELEGAMADLYTRLSPVLVPQPPAVAGEASKDARSGRSHVADCIGEMAIRVGRVNVGIAAMKRQLAI